MPVAPLGGLLVAVLMVSQPTASGQPRVTTPPAGAQGAGSARAAVSATRPTAPAQGQPPAQALRDSTPQAVVSWERITWAIEQGLQPVEIDRLRRFTCIPGRLVPATYARLFRALALWKLNDEQRDLRIDSWRCGTGVAAPAPTSPTAAANPPVRRPTTKAATTPPKAIAKAPVRAPAKPPVKAPTKAPTKAPVKAPPKSSAATSASAPVRAGVPAVPRPVATRGAPPAQLPSAARAPAAVGGGADTSVLLSVLSSISGLPVAVNRASLGFAPVSLRVPRGRLVVIAVGEGGQRRDTSLYVTGRHDLVVTVEQGATAASPGAGAPLPVAAALTRASVEAEMAMSLPALPRQPVMPVLRTPRGARTDLYWSLAVAGIASLASSSRCRQQATSPQPYGGTYSGTYHPAGTFVPSAFMLCTSAIGVAAGGASFPIFRIFSRFANEGERTRYVADSASLLTRQSVYLQVRQQRQAMIDSAFARRQLELAMPLLRWRVDTIPRRVP